jgi:bile acid:Na+ symporter, BASS family
MSAADLVQLAVPVSLGLIVVALGMRCSLGEATYLVREPGLLLRSVLSMNVLLPAVAVALAVFTPISMPAKVALIALAVSPVPPILPNKEFKLVTREDYVYGLLVTTSILSIVLIPLTLSLIRVALDRDFRIDAGAVARSVAFSVLVPLAVGMLLRLLFPSWAERFRNGIGMAGNILLLLALVPIAVAGWPLFATLVGDGTLMVCIGLTLIGLAIGHWLGGPNEDDRSVLALSTASRHPGVAVAIGTTLFPGDKKVAMAVLLFLVVATLASAPYSAWRKRRHRQVIGRP